MTAKWPISASLSRAYSNGTTVAAAWTAASCIFRSRNFRSCFFAENWSCKSRSCFFWSLILGTSKRWSLAYMMADLQVEHINAATVQRRNSSVCSRQVRVCMHASVYVGVGDVCACVCVLSQSLRASLLSHCANITRDSPNLIVTPVNGWKNFAPTLFIPICTIRWQTRVRTVQTYIG